MTLICSISMAARDSLVYIFISAVLHYPHMIYPSVAHLLGLVKREKTLWRFGDEEETEQHQLEDRSYQREIRQEHPVRRSVTTEVGNAEAQNVAGAEASPNLLAHESRDSKYEEGVEGAEEARDLPRRHLVNYG